MKLKYIIPIAFILLMLPFVYADVPMPPYAINGRASLVGGDCIGNFNIYLKAFNYNNMAYEEIIVPVNNNCEYSFSLGNSPFNIWMSNMKIDLRFCQNDNNCLKTIYIGKDECPSGGGCVVDFELSPTSIVSTPEGPEEAQEQVIKEVKKYICSDGTEVDDSSQCPEDTDEWFYVTLAALSAVFIGAGLRWGKGFIALLKYWFSKDKSRARKMLKTAANKWLWQK